MTWQTILFCIENPGRRSLYRRFCLLLSVFSLFWVVACGTNPNPTVNLPDSSAACGSPLGGPKDNPIQTIYGPAAFGWTNDIKWQCVFNVKDFAGPSDTERFLAARDAAVEAGGGVVYLPADIYYFREDLPLGDGVVVRGEAPEQLNPKEDGFVPPTRLVFPEYEPSRSGEGTPNETAFKKIITPNPDSDSNLGLVFLDIDRGAIDLTGNPDRGTMTNRIIFGVRSNNVAEPVANVPDTTFQPGWLRYSDPSAANIRLTTRENALVANNRLNDDITDVYAQSDYVVKTGDGGSTVTYAEGEKVVFSYTDHSGIVVNRHKPEGFTYPQTAADEPGLFRPGITVQDNWVFKTMGAGIRASGEGLTIRRNVVSDQPGKVTWVDPTGTRQPNPSMIFDNRAIDWSGHNVTIEGNNFVVYRHGIMDTEDFSADGEGIFIQPCCGGTSINGVAIRNNVGQGNISIDQVPDVQRVLVENNQVKASSSAQSAIFINADADGAPNAMEKVVVQNNQVEGGILTQASLGGSQIEVRGNQGSGAITFSCATTVQENSGLVEQPCVDTQQAQIP